MDDALLPVLKEFVDPPADLLYVEYRETHNPLRVWEVVASTAARKEPLPDWAVDVLATWAQDLLSIDPDGVKPADVLRALGLGGKKRAGSEFSRLKNRRQNLAIGLIADRKLKASGKSDPSEIDTKSIFYDEVAKMVGDEIGSKTAENCHKEYRASAYRLLFESVTK